MIVKNNENIRLKLMKRIYSVVIILVLGLVSCKAQNIPVEDFLDHYDSEDGLPDNIQNVLDINNVFDNFVGVWVGTATLPNGITPISYELHIEEYQSTTFVGRQVDELRVRYKIGNEPFILADTTTLPDDDSLILLPRFFLANKKSYQLRYQGFNSNCGQFGDIILTTRANGTELHLFYVRGRDLVSPDDCPSENYSQVFPEEVAITLTRQ